MSFVSQARDKLKREYESYKTNKRLENDPEVVRYKLNKAREEQKAELVKLKEAQAFERERQELKTLKRENSTLGRFTSATKQYVDSVKAKKQPVKTTKGQGTRGAQIRQQASLGTGRNIIYDQSPTNSFAGNSFMSNNRPSLIQQDVGRPNREVFGHSGGVLGQPAKVKRQAKKGSKTIVIKL